MEELKARNEAAGQHFFDPGAMRFFNSEVEVVDGDFFITSERMELDMPKRYTLHYMRPDGHVEEVGEFQGYDGLEGAEEALTFCVNAKAFVTLDPYPIHEGEAEFDMEHFHWRPFLGSEIPVGNRNTFAEAVKLANDLNTT